MKQTLFITTLVAVAVLCGICVPAQATTNTMTLAGIAPGSVQAWTTSPWTEAGYTLTEGSSVAWTAQAAYGGASGTPIGSADDYLVWWNPETPPLGVTITEDLAAPFYVREIIVGGLDNASSLTLTGTYATGGGAPTPAVLSAVADSIATYYYTNALHGLETFTNLATLVVSPTSGKACFDNIVMSTDTPPVDETVADPPAATEVFDFDAVALVNTTWAPLANMIEDGYIMTLDSGSGGFLTNTYNASINDFTGNIVTPWSGGCSVSFARNDDGLFSASTVALGVSLDTSDTAIWDVIGYLDGGGTVSNRYMMDSNVRRVVTLGPDYGNADLTKITFVEPAETDGQPALDDLTLTTNVIVYAAGTVLGVR